MLNPDRAELGLQPTSVSENPKKSEHIPRWLRVPVFTARTFLAILTVTPGMVVAADAIDSTENPSIVYADDTPIGRVIEIQRVGDCQWQVTVEITGLHPNTRLKGTNYNNRTDCVGNHYSDSYGPYDLGMADNSGRNISVHRQNDFGSYRKIITDSDGHQLSIQYSYDRNYTSKTPLPTRLATPTPDPLDIQIAEKKATLTAVTGEIEKEKQRREKENQARELDKTSTAVTSQLNALRTPLTETPLPTNTPKPTDTPRPSETQRPTFTPNSTATAEARAAINEASARFRGSLQATATEEAKPKGTPTPRPTIPEIRPTQAVPIVQPTTPGTPIWLWGLGATSLAGLAAYWSYERGRRKNSPPPPPSGMGGSAKGVTGGGPNPNTGPSTTPNFGPAQPKNPEWVIGQQEFERRWQAAKSKLSPVLPGDQGDESGYILDRFKAGMNVIHEVSLDDPTNVPEMDTRVRAGIEYLIPEIWPDSEIPKNFFDPDFFAPENLAKTIYLPESYRNLSSFTKGQKRDINRIRRTLLHALHPDLLKSGSDPKLQDSIDILLKQLNSAWPLINKLLS